jgi:hypothetical protein
MAKNERNFLTKEANINITRVTEEASSPEAPGILWKAGPDGGKLYKLKLNNHNAAFGANAVFNLYWSADGVTFQLIKTVTIAAAAADVPWELFTDFFDYEYLEVTPGGQKYLIVPPGGGFFMDVTSNAGAYTDPRSYGEDF